MIVLISLPFLPFLLSFFTNIALIIETFYLASLLLDSIFPLNRNAGSATPASRNGDLSE